MDPDMLVPILLGATALAFAVARKGRKMNSSPEEKRAAVVRLAAAELGSADRARYTVPVLGRDDRLSWCGIFALWAYQAAGLMTGVAWVLGSGFASRWLRPYSPTGPERPQQADLAYFTKNQHQAIVEDYDPKTDTVSLINGNGWGGQVTRTRHPRSAITLFYSVDRWVA